MSKLSGEVREKLLAKLVTDKDINDKLIVSEKYKPHIRIKDKEETIGSQSVHYEVFFSNKGEKVSVEIHFENEIGHNIVKSIHDEIEKDFPKNVNWIKKHNAVVHKTSIGFEDNLIDSHDENLYNEVKRRIMLLENKLGEILRNTIRSEVHRINILKEKNEEV